jgi:SAM-dependent methyltransferase
MGKVALYDDFSLDYDRFVDWPQRLAKELPFFLRLFSENGVKRVLDAACGTGHHALALARLGYEVVGADLSEAMVGRARANAAQVGVEVTFIQAGFGEFGEKVGDGFQTVICLGNSLPHLLSEEALRAALLDMRQIMEPKGLLIVQNRNYDRVWEKRERFMPLVAHKEGEEEWLFFRLMDFHPERLTFNLVTFHKEGGEWGYKVRATELRPIFKKEMEALLPLSGFEGVQFYGGYDFSPFDRERSEDLVVVARRN